MKNSCFYTKSNIAADGSENENTTTNPEGPRQRELERTRETPGLEFGKGTGKRSVLNPNNP